MIDNNSMKPIFIQIKEWIENEILEDRILSDEKMLSQNELAKFFGVNPMTALKGITILESLGVLRKQRGIGMFVTKGAKDIIYKSRMLHSLNDILDDLVNEAIVLKIPKEEIVGMVRQRFDNIEE